MMKKLTLLFLFIGAGLTLTAQTTPPETRFTHPGIAVGNATVNAVINKMRGKANDAEKVAVVKDEINLAKGYQNAGLMIEQVVMLLSQLNEDPKLEAAIYLYAFTVDYKKYGDVQDVFNEGSNKHKLQDYIDKHKKDK